jgi:SpoVK/Ycf46/Vps4 family AAA+-type ATPase
MKTKKAKYLGKVEFDKLVLDQTFELVEEEGLDDDLREFNTNDTRHFYELVEKQTKRKIDPGVYTSSLNRYGELELTPSMINVAENFGGVELQQSILNNCRTFFRKAHLIKDIGEDKVRRGVLLHGSQGVGKTFAINNTIKEMLLDGDLIVCKFDTSYRIGALAKLLDNLKPADEVKKLIILLEDIGGGEVDPEQSSRLSDTSLLNFLDGNSYSLDLPFVVFATTNYPQNMLANLIDRPGRFDEVIEVPPPSKEVKALFMEKLLKRSLTDTERKAISSELSMAHVKEAVIANILYDKPIDVRLKEMTEHSRKVRENFNKEARLGF